MKISRVGGVVSALSLLSYSFLARAAAPTPAPPIPAADKYIKPTLPVWGDSIPEFLLALVDMVFLIALPIIVISIIYSGFLFVTARENTAKIEKARTVFQWTIIGAVVLLSAKAISFLIQQTICGLDPTYTSYFC